MFNTKKFRKLCLTAAFFLLASLAAVIPLSAFAQDAGCSLLEAQSVSYGEWGTWLNSNFGLSQATANNYMKVAERFSADFEMVRNFKPAQLITLRFIRA